MPILDALAPLPANTNFPYPRLVQTSGPGQPSVTYEGPIINGIPMPGQWLLTKADRTYGWQKQAANFLTGAYLVPIGDPLMDIEYEVRIWEDGAMAIFLGLLGTLLSKPVVVVPGGVASSAALGIQDPALKVLKVPNVVVSAVSGPKNPLITSGGKGPWIGKVAFIEYRSAKPALPVPSQTIPDPGAVTPSAASNLATANAAVSAGATALDNLAAQQLLNH
jgi:hypothetical protein